MSLNQLIFAVLFPLIFWVAYHYYHDRHRPEPVANLVIALGLGALASILAGYGYQALGFLGVRYDAAALAETDLIGLFAYAVLGIGVVEESAKMLPFLVIVLRFRDFDEPMDGIVYASFLALGFSLIENLHYFDYLTAEEALARGFAGPVVHIVFASVWGYRIGAARLAGRSVIPAAMIWLGVAALLHGVYDFIVLGFSDVALLAAAAVIVAVWIWRLRLVWRLQVQPPENQ